MAVDQGAVAIVIAAGFTAANGFYAIRKRQDNKKKQSPAAEQIVLAQQVNREIVESLRAEIDRLESNVNNLRGQIEQAEAFRTENIELRAKVRQLEHDMREAVRGFERVIKRLRAIVEANGIALPSDLAEVTNPQGGKTT